MSRTFVIVMMSGTAGLLMAVLLVTLYRYADFARNVRKSIAENIEFCLFLYYFLDEKTHSVALPGLSMADLRNIGNMVVIRDLIDSGALMIDGKTMTLSKQAWKYLRTFTAKSGEPQKDEREFGEELLQTLRLPHLTDKYASVNFDMI